MIEPNGAERICAIYTRKSTEEGLEQAFNTLQAQREAGEAYIQSQRQAGWVATTEHYDDGGFSGASLERPALQRLLAAVDAGQIGVVVVYKVDRLSRSLLDFARLMERFDRHGVSFVSVTQDFNTTSSLGRLTLHILLSFAQFEREIISERTRDKLSAARRKGKWIGGWPVLGYDVDAKGGRLIVNPREAEQVRKMYRIAAETDSLESAHGEISALNLQTKAWKTRGGKRHVARPFSRMTLRHLLSNVLYTGSVNHKGTIYPGEHERLVEQELWERVSQRLALRSIHQRGRAHRQQEAPLRGLLVCAPCGRAMLPSHTTRHGRRYRYYTCPGTSAQEEVRCSQAPVASADLEAFVLQQLHCLLGSGLNWTGIGESIERIQYCSMDRSVGIVWKDGTRAEYVMPFIKRSTHKGLDGEDMGRVPRISQLMALAIKFHGQVRSGVVRSHRDIAEAGHISRARMSQIMRLTDLAPTIQEELLFLPKTVSGTDRITERALRQVAASMDWDRQKKQFDDLKLTSFTGAAKRRA